MIIVKLPRMSTFTSRKKEASPYILFYKWLAPHLPHWTEISAELYDLNEFGCPKGYNLSVSEIGICEEDEKKLNRKVKSWIKHYSERNYIKHIYKPKYIDSEIEKIFAYHHLDIGPMTYIKKDRPKHIVPGYVYIKEGYMVEDTRND